MGYYNDLTLTCSNAATHLPRSATAPAPLDVQAMATETGLSATVVLAPGLLADIHAIPPRARASQDAAARLWTVLYGASRALQRLRPGECALTYPLFLHVGHRVRYTVQLTLSTGDNDATVVTLSRLGESQ